MSKSENKIADILNNERIKFIREKTFSDLKHGQFRFDFCIYTARGPILVEYDGEQHFQYISVFYKNRREWDKMREHDRRKNSYCLANDIPLYRIPYWELCNIKSFTDMTQPKFLVKSRWHNDNLYAPKK